MKNGDSDAYNREELTFRQSGLNGFSKLSVITKSLVVLGCHSDVIRVAVVKSFDAASVLTRGNFGYPQPMGTL